jgi:PTH1 family peptidyl-tRNA hydrolase
VKLLVGLGNPGPEYADTRHNIGVRVLEQLARHHGIAFGEHRFASRFGVGRLRGDGLPVALLAPQTFMNRSGAAVAEAVRELSLDDPESDLLVVFDDVDLPFGRLRLRASGGAGGHRGLADVLLHLDRRDVPRLRFGVGRPPGSLETADHVLAPFSEAEAEQLPAAIGRATEAAVAALRDGVTAAMNVFNREPERDAGGAGDAGEENG